MPKSNPLEVLLTHDAWATRQLLDACAKLTNEQFHQRFEMGCGSLHDTLTHVISAKRLWTQVLAVVEPGPRMDQDGRHRAASDLIAAHEDVARDFDAQAGRAPLDQIVTRVREGKAYHMTRGAVLAHVVTHGVHHRAQCLNMLRRLGVSPLPPGSVIEWTRLVDIA